MGIVIIVPLFNEAKRWNENFFESLLEIDYVNWVFVDDGSDDETFNILLEFKLKHPEIEIIKHDENSGKSNAIKTGMIFAFDNVLINDFGWIGFMDSDGAFSKEDVVRIVGKIGEMDFNYDSIWSSRIALSGRKIERSLIRHHISRVIASYFGLFLVRLPYDTQSGFKIYKADLSLKKSLEIEFKTKWFFDIELMCNIESVNQKQLRIWEEPLLSWKEISGSKIKIRSFTKFLIEIIQVTFKLRISAKL